MLKSKDNDQVVSFRLTRSTNGTFQISKREAMNRTKHMIAFDKGLGWDDVTVGKKLEDDLGYSEGDKKSLKGLIENVFFRDVQIDINDDELERAATIRDLYGTIWSQYNKIGTKGIKGIPKITELETMRRTKKMIAKPKNLSIDEVTVEKKLKDLMYSPKDKKDLKLLIEKEYFYDVSAFAHTSDLVKAATVGDVMDVVWDKCINEKYKEY